MPLFFSRSDSYDGDAIASLGSVITMRQRFRVMNKETLSKSDEKLKVYRHDDIWLDELNIFNITHNRFFSATYPSHFWSHRCNCKSL